jgi:hypothetical protein
MIYIKKSLQNNQKLFLVNKYKNLPNPMTFTYWCMATYTIILIRYPDNKNYIKSLIILINYYKLMFALELKKDGCKFNNSIMTTASDL